MSLRTACPTLFRLIPAFFRIVGTVVRFVLHLITFRWWTWRLTRRLAIATAILATLLALSYAIENWRGRRAFAAVARQAAAAGISLNLRDQTPPPVPADLNLAKLPLLDAPGDPKARELFWNALNASLTLQSVNRDTPQKPWSLPGEHRPSFLENRPGDIAAFRDAMLHLESEKGRESLASFLGRTTPLLEELATAAEARPYLRYEYDWKTPVDAFVNTPHFGTLRSLAQAADCHALLAIEARQPAQAARPICLVLRLGSALRDDPFLITKMIAAAMDRPAESSIWQGQLSHVWTHAELDTFATLLAKDGILPGVRRAYVGEAAFGVSLLLQLPSSVPDLAVDREATLARIWGRWLPSGWIYQNAASVARHHLTRSLPSLDLEASRVRPETFGPDDQGPHSGFYPYDVFSRMIGVSLKNTTLRAGQAKTTRDLARLALALEKHLLARGAYPESLAPVLAADPALAALHDPFDGQPYRYRRDPDGGFTLWGIGQNLRDDGGAYPAMKGPSSPRYDTGDLVWHIPAPPRR